LKIITDKWFQLPWIGKETYADLMKAKVKRDSKFGFKFASDTNASRALSILSAALGESVELARSCFICDGPIEGEAEIAVFESTLCTNCMKNEDAYDLYIMRFAKLMETA
jgi:hypothetical protein